MDCLNCGTPLGGRHCAQCGQAAATARLGGRDLVRPLLGLFDADRGWLHTAAELTRRPGGMINDYLAGRRVPYSEPLKYTTVAVALAMFALWLAPLPRAPEPDAAASALLARANDLLQRYGNVLMLITVPLLAGGSRWLFRARGLNLAEHVVLSAYVFAQQNLLSLPFLALTLWWPAWHGPGMAAYYGLCLAYYAWVLRAVAARTWWGALLGAIGITVLAYVLFWVIFLLIVRAVT